MRYTAMKTLIFSLIGTYLVLAAILFLFQSRFIYFPYREIISTPHDIGLPYEAIFFKADDGVELAGWFVPAQNPRGVILFCHGNAGNVSNRLQSIEIFHRLGLSTFIFDYRGYGQSEGKPTEQGTYLDARAAWNYLRQKRGIESERIIIFGESLGGAVAAWLAKDHRPAALILNSTFTSVPELAAKLYPFFPVKLLSRFSYNTADYIRHVDCPVLIVHSCDDEIVPYSHGCKLYESAKQPKDFLEIRGDHNTGFILSGEAYIDGLDMFISKLLGVRLSTTPP